MKKGLVHCMAAAALLATGAATAQDYPTKGPIRLMVGFAAGGGTDVLGRIIGRKLSEVLGQQVVI